MMGWLTLLGTTILMLPLLIDDPLEKFVFMLLWMTSYRFMSRMFADSTEFSLRDIID
jgi:hypothetical protein